MISHMQHEKDRARILRNLPLEPIPFQRIDSISRWAVGTLPPIVRVNFNEIAEEMVTAR